MVIDNKIKKGSILKIGNSFAMVREIEDNGNTLQAYKIYPPETQDEKIYYCRTPISKIDEKNKSQMMELDVSLCNSTEFIKWKYSDLYKICTVGKN